MIFYLVIGVLISTIIILLIISIIVGRIKAKDKEKFIWNLNNVKHD